MAHGGKREPDGRQAQAKGIGKNAKRHDLEQPRSVPPLQGSDLQSGDVQRLEAAQKTAPIAKPQTSAGATGSSPSQGSGDIEVPDAIDFAGSRTGQDFGGQANALLDGTQWMPLLQEIARNPNRSGPLATALLTQLANITNTPSAGRVQVVDENAIQEAISRSVS